MKADEWRKLAQEAPERKRQAEQAETQRICQRYLEERWAEARRVVAALDDRIRQAAYKSEEEFVLYELTCYGTGRSEGYKPPYSPVLETTQRAARGGLFKQARPQVVEIRYIPEFAQYVFDSCPPDLHPRWEGVDKQYIPPGEPGSPPWQPGGICHGNFGGGITKGIRLWLSCRAR